MSAQIAVHPELARLQGRGTELRERLAQAHTIRAELEQHKGPYLEALYMQSLGALELELLQSRAANAGARRHIELIRALANRREELNAVALRKIDAQLDREMRAWRERTSAQERRLRDASSRLNAIALTLEQSARLKWLYQRMVRTLHPDMTGGETDLYRSYWHAVQSAYKNADLDQLELLWEVIRHREAHALAPDSSVLDQLRGEIERLEAMLNRQMEALSELQQRPPFCYEEQLRDSQWITDMQAQLQAQIETEMRLAEQLKAILEDLLPKASLACTVH